MMSPRPTTLPRPRLRAAGLVRTLVVATSTLAILIVCYSIYQGSMESPTSEPAVDLLATPSARGMPDTQSADPDDVPRVDTGIATLGPGQKIEMTFYPKSGNQGRVELAVEKWTPVRGSPNEFLLVNPDIRMRTEDGHAVQITAKQGILEAQRKVSPGLDPKRGQLTGDIVIRYDRLTEEQRAKLPPEQRDVLSPDQLVRVEMDQLEFDLEYGKLVVPGQLRVRARDIEFDATGLEMRFNQSANRVEQVRVDGGGSIRLLDFSPDASILNQSPSNQPNTSVPLAEWFRASFYSYLQSEKQASAPGTSGDARPTPPPPDVAPDGTPILRITEAKQNRTQPSTRYIAHFEGNVDVAHRIGKTLQARLLADALELVRSLSDKQRDAIEVSPKPEGQSPAAPVTKPEEVIELQWRDRLLVEVCALDDALCDTAARASIVATGSPARVQFADGRAACQKLEFDPDGMRVWLHGSDAHDATVALDGEGSISGRTIHTEQNADEFAVSVTGPGELRRAATTKPGDTTPEESRVRFADSLNAKGKSVDRTGLDLKTARVTRKRWQVLQEATFVGDVALRQNQTTLAADNVHVTFDPTRIERQSIRKVEANGHVSMLQEADRILCNQLDVDFDTLASGETIPKSAVASGHVTARQAARTIRAEDQIDVQFRMIERPATPFDLDKERGRAVAAGLDPNSIDWKEKERLHDQKRIREPGVSKLTASGGVSVVDPDQSLSIAAQSLSCDLADGRDITDAIIKGVDEHPASVTVDTVTVEGPSVLLNVPDQRAEVPSAGQLTLMSDKDLDGRKLDRPTPIVITWKDRMRYEGRANRSVFQGDVHAASRRGTTFDCQRLQVDFEDIPQGQIRRHQNDDRWWLCMRAGAALPTATGSSALALASLGLTFRDQVADFTERLTGQPVNRQERFSKQPASILATKHAVAVTSEFNDDGSLRSRSSISGPKLSVNLRSEESKLLIEGPGSLLIEDLNVDTEKPEKQVSGNRMFGVAGDSGPSNTLVQWRNTMWYDFALHRTRFSGDVQLSYVSGRDLLAVREDLPSSVDEEKTGRKTFLSCDQLTVDFALRRRAADSSDANTLGGLSTDHLRQFEARSNVELQDSAEGLRLSADRVVFRKDSCLLSIFGSTARNANIVKKRAGRLPHQVSVKHVFYNTCTGEIEVSQPALRSP